MNLGARDGVGDDPLQFLLQDELGPGCRGDARIGEDGDLIYPNSHPETHIWIRRVNLVTSLGTAHHFHFDGGVAGFFFFFF